MSSQYWYGDQYASQKSSSDPLYIYTLTALTPHDVSRNDGWTVITLNTTIQEEGLHPHSPNTS